MSNLYNLQKYNDFDEEKNNVKVYKYNSTSSNKTIKIHVIKQGY